MRGILTYGAHVPYRRLDRTEISKFFGSGGGKGTRAVASYDEDTTSMGVEAARHALRSTPGLAPQALLFATTSPAYVDKTNATTIHAALRLDHDVPAFDANGAVRSGVGAWRAALAGGGPTMVVTADVRNGFATSGVATLDLSAKATGASFQKLSLSKDNKLFIAGTAARVGETIRHGFVAKIDL